MLLKNRYTVCWLAVLTWSCSPRKGAPLNVHRPPVPLPPPLLRAVLRRPVRRQPLRVLRRLPPLRALPSIARKNGR